MADSPQEYLEAAPDPGRAWLREFWQHVQTRSAAAAPTMFRGVPMYKFANSYLEGYIMFTAAKNHFAVHALDFDLVQQARAAIPGAAGGKGSVRVTYGNVEATPALKELVDAVLRRHGLLA
ncbi:MAG: hypothetical protein V9F82_03925 [Dermatophilaceae bacterium]